MCSTCRAPVGICLSLASIGVGWVVYDLLCKSPLGKSDTGLMLVLYGVLVFMAWGYTQLFTGRAAFLHLGAFTATIMSANVFMVIIPNQKIVVADLIAGRKPDPKYGKIAKQRSLHNNYLTLPVLFLMLSNHYPLAFGTAVQLDHRLAGLPHRRADPALFQHDACPQGQSDLDLAGRRHPVHRHHLAVDGAESADRRAEGIGGGASLRRFCAFPRRARHGARPLLDVPCAPSRSTRASTTRRRVLCSTRDAAIAEHAREIYLQAGRSHAMPPGNVTEITDEERALLVAWFERRRDNEHDHNTSARPHADPSCAGPKRSTTHAACRYEEDGGLLIARRQDRRRRRLCARSRRRPATA